MKNKYENINKWVPTRPMTQFTKDILEERIVKLQEELKKHQLATGEAVDKGDEYHDNFAFEEASRKVDMTSAQIVLTREKIRNAVIIAPRQQTDSIDLGNTIVVRFDDESEDETFILLGPDDARQNPGWISYESPLGMQLMNRKVGDRVEYQVDKDQRKLGVTVKAIFPGDF